MSKKQSRKTRRKTRKTRKTRKSRMSDTEEMLKLLESSEENNNTQEYQQYINSHHQTIHQQAMQHPAMQHPAMQHPAMQAQAMQHPVMQNMLQNQMSQQQQPLQSGQFDPTMVHHMISVDKDREMAQMNNLMSPSQMANGLSNFTYPNPNSFSNAPQVSSVMSPIQSAMNYNGYTSQPASLPVQSPLAPHPGPPSGYPTGDFAPVEQVAPVAPEPVAPEPVAPEPVAPEPVASVAPVEAPVDAPEIKPLGNIQNFVTKMTNARRW